MSLAAGTRLDSFEIVAPLGAGGMGEVYRARDTALKRDVAIKVLPDYWSRDPERLRRFEQEAQAAAALNHPNIVSIHHVGRYDGSPYIVTELLQGETLRERLRKGALELREALDFGVEIARGLGAAHDAGVIHRDLKPENIFVTKDARIKILDFGLAKLQVAKFARHDSTITIPQQTIPGQLLGTVGYMSPEQVRGHSTDARSDIFAAGAVLYEMLTGNPAFRKATTVETMSAILNEDPPAISQVAPNLPPGLQRILNRCLAKIPEQRFQHAWDVAFALETITDSGTATSIDIRAQTSNKQWRWIAGAVALVAIAIATFSWLNRSPSEPAVESVTQLTDDGVPKEGWMATDGSRVYFNEGTMGSWSISQVSVAGGVTSVIPTPLVSPQLTAIAADGSSLLVFGGVFDKIMLPLWKVPLPSGEPRRVGGIESIGADFFPDGRVLYPKDAELYVADADGSGTRSLLKAPVTVACPKVAPDGMSIVFRNTGSPPQFSPTQYYVASGDGSSVHQVATIDMEGSCAVWTADGRYLLYRVVHPDKFDIWVLPLKTGIFRRQLKPIQLTNGPLSYTMAIPSRDGKRIFAIGTKRRGELVRYDSGSKQFVPLLSGISAVDPTFSQDGQWVAYTSYPDHTLWRSRADGSDRLQLTYPPTEVSYPFISPDGKHVSYGCRDGLFIIGIDGGAAQKIANEAFAGTWSPDGDSLAFTARIAGKQPGEKNIFELGIFNLRNGKLSVIPSSQGRPGGQWVTNSLIVATPEDNNKLMVFDFSTGNWSELVGGLIGSVAHSLDWKYVYYTTAGAEPKVMRLRISDRRVEEIASLKDLRRVVDPIDNDTQVSVAPDGSPVFTRDIGTQEIYALTVKWP